MKKLNHPNVVKGLAVPKPLDVKGTTELPLLAMEYCDGGNLRQVKFMTFLYCKMLLYYKLLC